MPARYVLGCWVLAVVAASIGPGDLRTGAARGGPEAASAFVPACRLRLAPPTGGSPLFAVPAGGRAIARILAGRILLCTLLRADGSTFARARIDRLDQVLDVRFYRTSGRLLFAADAAYPAIAVKQGAQVSCGSAANSSIGKRYWRQAIRWRLGKTTARHP